MCVGWKIEQFLAHVWRGVYFNAFDVAVRMSCIGQYPFCCISHNFAFGGRSTTGMCFGLSTAHLLWCDATTVLLSAHKLEFSAIAGTASGEQSPSACPAHCFCASAPYFWCQVYHPLEKTQSRPESCYRTSQINPKPSLQIAKSVTFVVPHTQNCPKCVGQYIWHNNFLYT